VRLLGDADDPSRERLSGAVGLARLLARVEPALLAAEARLAGRLEALARRALGVQGATVARLDAAIALLHRRALLGGRIEPSTMHALIAVVGALHATAAEREPWRVLEIHAVLARFGAPAKDFFIAEDAAVATAAATDYLARHAEPWDLLAAALAVFEASEIGPAAFANARRANRIEAAQRIAETPALRWLEQFRASLPAATQLHPDDQRALRAAERYGWGRALFNRLVAPGPGIAAGSPESDAPTLAAGRAALAEARALGHPRADGTYSLEGWALVHVAQAEKDLARRESIVADGVRIAREQIDLYARVARELEVLGAQTNRDDADERRYVVAHATGLTQGLLNARGEPFFVEADLLQQLPETQKPGSSKWVAQQEALRRGLEFAPQDGMRRFQVAKGLRDAGKKRDALDVARLAQQSFDSEGLRAFIATLEAELRE
jgi:hypothetical protein